MRNTLLTCAAVLACAASAFADSPSRGILTMTIPTVEEPDPPPPDINYVIKSPIFWFISSAHFGNDAFHIYGRADHSTCTYDKDFFTATCSPTQAKFFAQALTQELTKDPQPGQIEAEVITYLDKITAADKTSSTNEALARRVATLEQQVADLQNELAAKK